MNRLLRGATDTTFISLIGETPAFPPDVRYVVTLDSDTRLPRDTVRRLIGKMAHPLNWPRFDAASQRVVEGYAVLQPRVTPSLPVGQEGSLFQQIFSSLSGIDPYASAVSDLYQDMFGEGSYAGKGIYDVDAFEASLAGRMPESAILSHDLFEGIFARAGFASDVEVVEEFPARYDVGAIRHHRWARGDWQLLPWILGRRPTKSTLNRAASAIPAVGRWKMVDNLRRTLSAPAAIAALLIGWCLPIHDALIWAAFVLSTIVLPTLIPVIAAIPSRRQGIPILSHLRALRRDGRLAFALSALTITFLAHQAWLMADAIGRTLWRLLISRRHLLEWVPAAQAMSGRRLDIFGFFQKMIGAPFIAAIAVTSAVVSAQGTWIPASVVAVFWAISPIVARWVSLPPRTTGRARLSDKDARVLRLTARRTWRFFETFVTPADRMLPPDNFQEDPAPVLAHRTSPTNIGLYLLSVVSAHDFGWIGTGVAIERLEATLATMSDMARFRGHFYNWYDTQDLRPLDPKYVSSVDSGNLLGHLIALANACREWRSRAIQITPRIAGIADAVDLLQEASAALRDGRLTQTVTWRQAEGVLEGLRGALNSPPPSLDSLAPWLSDLAAQAETMADISGALAIERGDDAAADMQFWAKAVQGAIAAHRHDLSASVDGAGTCDERLSAIEASARAMAMAMEFGFLLDEERKLLSIGYLVPEGALDSNCYDLLASEARLASFMAIAKGDVPARHWFRLGRSVTPVANRAALISWSGSMFEYLMPSLVMRAPAGSLLEQTNRSIVRRQIDYAGSLNIPWGISESAYNARDLEFTYQYSNFGVPGLGVKRGLGENLVVAPYATALATMVDPQAATTNFARLTSAGVRGRYGFYEAVDFTPARVPTHSRCVIVRAYMAHHQGMTIVALADALFDGVMRTRFHAEPIVQATELLLQERSPREVPKSHAWAADVKLAANNRDAGHLAGRRYTSAHQVVPVTHLLSNGRYSTMITAAGSGYSRWRDIAVTRWREDATCDDYGSYIFLRDVQTGQAWSAGFQSSGAEPDAYHVAFDEGRAEITRRDGSLSTTLEVILSPEDDAEVRRISISNNGSRVREIELTSYAELALAPHAADVAHPAFSKLFVETQYLSNVGAIVATRRKRAPTDAEIWAAHLSVVDGESILLPEFETDRARFVGRGHSVRNPVAMIDGRPLSNTVGTVLDPIFALRRRLRIQPGSTARVSFWTMLAPTRAALLGCIDKHRESTAFSRASTLAWTQAQVQLHHVGITAGEAGLFQRLAGHVIYAATTLRPTSDTIARGAGAQQGLWAQSISGDLPIVLLRISHIEDILVARELLQAREYWRLKQLAVDLVIINERRASYIQDLQIALETMVRVSQSAPQAGGDAPRGGVFVLRADLVPDETQALLVSSARVVLVAHRGSLFDQLERIVESTTAGHALPKLPAPPDLQSLHAPSDLEFFNGTGGFAANGSEYVTILGPGQATPAPWINVIANPTFGFQVSSEGSGYTWSSNSRENQLSPWSNDPVTDRPGEALYLRDEDTGDVWSPTALPIRIPERTYVAHHGRGYSRFKGLGYGIASDLVQYVPIDAPIKVSRLVLHNRSSRTRTLSVTAYVEWVLGPSRSVTRPFVMTEMDSETGAMFARNPWSRAFGAQVAFLDLSGKQTEWSGDRQEFIGRNGTLEDPAALGRTIALSNKVGAGFDPAGVMRTHVTIPPDGRVEIVVFLGEAGTAGEAHDLIKRYRVANLDEVEADIASFWKGVLGSVQVRTPDRAMDIMLNGWLLYQTLACRVWARSAFYQASGAYGFRDQLQDGTALATSCPQLTRDHILRAAGRQFSEGDVQHWWLPHSGEGVRTRISDDRIWLVYCVSHYVTTTGDAGVLDEVVPYLHGQRLLEGDHDSFFQPVAAEHSGSLFEHCIRALEQSLALGPHGLPLIGTGDWNDGMNRVGEKGTGESVWLGWFLHAAIGAFAPIAEGKGCAVHAATWRAHAHALQIALEQEAWDGGWYRRGFFDDGTPFGSAASQECRIDSIAQSWAVLSGAAQQDRAEQAMAAFERELIKDGLSLLLTPPFDKTHLDPGYIKGYPPGIRENGGQYTHAALWSVMAQAALGEGDKAVALFSLLNPINHARSRADVHRYKVEPYVVAADIYASPQHMGRGGWTWYTGAAGWMQRAGIESILGVRLQGAELHIDPCIPKSWPGFEITVRYRSTSYLVIVENPAGVSQGIAAATLDHEAVVVVARPLSIPLDDDGILHRVHVKLGVRADD